MPSFEIPDGPTSVALKDQSVKGQTVHAGTATFSVTNKTGQPLAGRLSVQAQGNAKAEWFTIMGEPERNFAASETQKITVNVNAPATAAIGDYKFRFRAVNVNDPDNDYTESPVATFNVAAATVAPKKPFPWWIVAVGVVALLLIVGGIVAFLVIPGTTKVAVPDVASKSLSYADASKVVTDAGLTAAQNPTPATTGTPGTVVSQDPTANTQVDKGSTVTLTVAATPPPAAKIAVPDVSGKGLSYATAAGQISTAGLTPQQSPTPATTGTPGTVVSQDPAASTQVDKGATVTLTVANPPPAALADRFVGTWVNQDPNTRNITRVQILSRGNVMVVHMWGACHPTDCDWGTAAGSRASANSGVLPVTWQQGFVVRTQQLRVLPDSRLQVVERSHFTDNSGRADYSTTDYFVKR